jgi:hypothetical protein
VYEIAGISMVLISLITLMALAIITALRLRRLAARALALRSHPMLDPEWLRRKRAVLSSMADNAQRISAGFARLKAAFDAIAQYLDELAVAGFVTAAAVEEILSTTTPWLRGLLAARDGDS